MIRYDEMKVTSLPLTAGVDEISPSNKVPVERAIEMENWRLSKDGSRIEKRLGLVEEVTNFAVDLFGYTTYKNLAGTFCELAILESGISRFVTGGAWGSIHSFIVGATPTNIAHPVIPIEVQGKMFVINEVDSRMIHHDSADYRIGIVKPTGEGTETLPVCSPVYSTAASQPLDDPMVYATQGAMDAVWTDSDITGGTSTVSTSDPDGKVGPQGDSDYMKLSIDTMVASAYASRDLTAPVSIATVFNVETALYFKNSGTSIFPYTDIIVWTGVHKVVFRWKYNGLWLWGLEGYQRQITTSQAFGAWHTWKFTVEGNHGGNLWIKCYLDDVSLGTFTYFNPTTLLPYRVQATGYNGTGAVIGTYDTYIDYLKVQNPADPVYVLEGEYRYAVTYYRGGNYPAESNPIKSHIGDVSFVGTGTNDMTVTGEYTGSKTAVFRVKVNTGNAGGGVSDILEWSMDDGVSWQAKVPCCGTSYIGYGLTLTFATTTTGHTTGDYWTFTCYVCSGMPTIQEVTLTALPVSADPQVTARKIYRTRKNGTVFYYLATINDNVTTTMTDNMDDSLLGAEVEEDHDTMPNGKFSAWWEDALWVVDVNEDIIYYSQKRFPEHFDIDVRYLTIQKGNPNDEITGLKAYKDSLYVFTKKSIYAIQKTVVTEGYGVFLVCQDIGCRAPWSIVEVNSTLMFISDRGIEIFNGVDVYPICPSDIIERTIGTINPAYYEMITSVHHKQAYEVWFSIPDRTSGSAIVIVYHYPTNSFYFFSFYKAFSCLASVFNSSGQRVTKAGTRDGYLLLTESTYRDNTTAITATYRKGWIETLGYDDIRRLEVEYELPTGMTLTSNVYVNFDKDAQRTDSHSGGTPSATDIELRRPIFDFSELGQRAKFFSVEFVNAENVGGALKINDIKLYHRDRAHKGRVSAD